VRDRGASVASAPTRNRGDFAKEMSRCWGLGSSRFEQTEDAIAGATLSVRDPHVDNVYFEKLVRRVSK